MVAPHISGNPAHLQTSMYISFCAKGTGGIEVGSYTISSSRFTSLFHRISASTTYDKIRMSDVYAVHAYTS